MFLKLTQLTFCFVFALTVMSQDEDGVTNGYYTCGKGASNSKNTFECKDPNYVSATRFQLFGIDCCNEVANNSMKDFQKIARDVTGDLHSLLQDPAANTPCTPDESQAATLVNNINKIVMKLSSTCKRYTDIMALKNQLQCHVFNKDATNDVGKIAQLTKLLISLQTAAIDLQNIERESGSSCVEFTARQYYHIYKSRFEDENSAFDYDKLANRTFLWRSDVNDCCEWGKYN